MATTINLTDVMNSLNNLMGHRVSAGGTDTDWQRYVQESFKYAWRYYKWGFSLKTAAVASDGLLPIDFDYEGYRAFAGTTEVDLSSTLSSTTGVAVVWDATTSRYKLQPAGATTVVYQYTPPTLGTDAAGAVPFPSAQVIAVGATIYAKMGQNPTRADVTQEWDQFHAQLDRLVGRADAAKPHVIQTYHTKMGTFVGDVGN